ncbi:hypothetical protein H257_16118 [Aphanomyces astaci]|uniref:RNase H type-1 domain-containing protein n=1 Tax=Aphanomyces astaci TaxID=112090 RepID=W4FLR5_APHAT|nr:hypothetical protein H257_16118 [Aphanomyces astaci]ETV67759.1 hypothetical protein H257_16118 [Aphanomyces astaci]|eukprot:XP_009842752.1 hypothetical protein H257_16118 [Aphanomyces astaci]
MAPPGLPFPDISTSSYLSLLRPRRQHRTYLLAVLESTGYVERLVGYLVRATDSTHPTTPGLAALASAHVTALATLHAKRRQRTPASHSVQNNRGEMFQCTPSRAFSPVGPLPGSIAMPYGESLACYFLARFLPDPTTNSQAEYDGLLGALRLAQAMNLQDLEICGHSNLGPQPSPPPSFRHVESSCARVLLNGLLAIRWGPATRLELSNNINPPTDPTWQYSSDRLQSISSKYKIATASSTTAQPKQPRTSQKFLAKYAPTVT